MSYIGSDVGCAVGVGVGSTVGAAVDVGVGDGVGEETPSESEWLPWSVPGLEGPSAASVLEWDRALAQYFISRSKNLLYHLMLWT